MPKLLVLYYSSYGHIETMAGAIAEGAREVPNAEVTIKRVPELVPEEVARKSHFKVDQAAPIATVDELPQYDAIIFGTPTRFGNMCAQMRNFLRRQDVRNDDGPDLVVFLDLRVGKHDVLQRQNISRSVARPRTIRHLRGPTRRR